MNFKEYVNSLLNENIVDNINYGVKINNLFNEWNRIKNAEQHLKWSEKIGKLRFGTYKTQTILDVINNFNPKFPNEVIKNDFLKECRNAINKYQDLK